MNLILDTHVLLWWLAGASELSDAARRLISDPSHVVFVSAASVWEIRIKQRLGKLSVPPNFASTLSAQSMEELSINHAHAHAVEKLPMLHRDPFDRMLIAQAKCEGLIVVTHDRMFERYGISVEIVA
jgi:PIN domain nuclease of toxin-antitoxin system